jgi:hypothetical protein
MHATRRLSCLALLPALAAFQAPPSSADEPASTPILPRVVPVCPRAPKGGEIVVCGSKERSPYRVPLMDDSFDWRGTVESVSRERNGLLEGGESGIGSCSPSGPGGASGCFARGIKQSLEQRAGSKRSGGGLEF